MKAPTRGKKVYKLPAPEARELDYPPIFWQRARIVIPCFDMESAMQLSAKIAPIVAHDVEEIIGITNDAATENYGEVVIAKKFVPVDIGGLAMAANEADGIGGTEPCSTS